MKLVHMEPFENCFCSPHENDGKDDNTSAIKVLKYLSGTLEDQEGKTLLKRQQMLVYHYLGLQKKEMDVGELPYMSVVLEFFAYNLNGAQEFTDIFECLLSQCQRRILINKASDVITCIGDTATFLTSLGHCLVFTTGFRAMQTIVIDLILHLFRRDTKLLHELPTNILYKAARKSNLVEITNKVMRATEKHIYNGILEIIYILIDSCSCGDMFLAQGTVDYSLERLTFSGPLGVNDVITKEMTSDILWALIKSTKKGKEAIEFRNRTISLRSLRNLREWFRREIIYGKSAERENISALILEILMHYPKLEIEKSGILIDICQTSVIWPFGAQNTWADSIDLKYLFKEAALQKILTTIVCYTLKNPLMCLSAREFGFITSLALRLEMTDYVTSDWSLQQKKETLIYTLHALPIVADYMPEDYMKCGATTRILQLIKYFSDKQRNLNIVKTCCKCLHSLLNKICLHQHFKEMHIIPTITDLINNLLLSCKLTLIIQAVLDISCKIVSVLVQSDTIILQKFAQLLNSTSIRILKRLQSADKFDSKIKSSFIISAGFLVWNSTILNSYSKNIFLNNNGIYLLLDIMEKAEFPVQLVYTGILADCCNDGHCIPQIITWRGQKTTTNLLSYLCEVWRIQEEKKEVERDENYCIEECCLMGKQQRALEVTSFTSSPALVEVIGCVRPKIASIVHLLLRRYNNLAELARSVYLIPYEEIPAKDKVTLEIIKYYEELKEGEVFWEIQEAQYKTNAIFLPLDLTVIHNLVMRNVGWANCIQNRQRATLNIETKKEIKLEEQFFDDIRETQLKSIVLSLKAIHNYLNLSHSDYKKKVNIDRKTILEKMEMNIVQGDYYHRTFSSPRDFTLIKSGKTPIVKSYLKLKYKKNN